ncbi:MAG: EpsG family protein, partial [Alphaproteobacteria bacterium]|nr:EpsG family protein [Alphaproteobacteria bacterium]
MYALFIGAYVFEPPPRNYINDLDLAVYLPMIEDFGKLSLIEAFQKYNDGLYARDFIFWFFGTIQAPHMIPAITTSTVYAVAFYITCDTAARYNSERYIPIIVLFQISMLPYFTIVNNVRNVFSLALVVLAVYLDLVRKKSFLFVFFCYIFGCLMHLSTAVLIVFRVFCLPLKNCFELVFVLPVIFKPLVDIIYSTNIFSFLGGELGNRVHQILSRLHQYMNNDFAAYSIISVNSITVKFDRT